MSRFIGLGLIVVLTLAAALATSTRELLWRGYADYRSPFLGETPAGPARAGLSSQVVFVFVRGLTADASRLLPSLNALRERGAEVTLEFDAAAPPFDASRRVTLASGATAEIHGITTGSAGGKPMPDTVFRQAARLGQSAVMIGSQEWADLAAGVGRAEVLAAGMANRDEAATALALDVIADGARTPRNAASLVALELTEFGAQPARAQAADRQLQAIVNALDLQRKTLVVVGDGMQSAPLITAGAGVKPGARLTARAEDAAPTLAALSGASFPLHAQGGVVPALLDDPNAGATLAASAAQLAAFYEMWSEIVGRPRFASEALRAHQDRFAARPALAYQSLEIDLVAKAAAARAARLTSEQVQRLPVALGSGLALLAVAVLLIGIGRWRAAVGAAVCIGLGWLVFAVVRGHSLSLAEFAGSSAEPFWERVAADARLVIVGVCVLMALTMGGMDDWLEALAATLAIVGLVAVACAGVVVWYYLNWGLTPTWALPDSGALVLALVALTNVAALSFSPAPGVSAVPLALVIAVAAPVAYAFARQRHHKRGSRSVA